MDDYGSDEMNFRLLDSTDLPPVRDSATSRAYLEDAVFDQGDFRRQILDLLEVHGEELADRSTYPGHLTGSALVIDSTGERVLLLLHAKLGRWLQPGGHADGDHQLAGVALREATEETGIVGLRVLVPAVDLDVHEIPERGSDPIHLHLDARFVVIAPIGATVVGNSESRELRWLTRAEAIELSDEPGLIRLIDRGLAALRTYRQDSAPTEKSTSDSAPLDGSS